MSLIKVVSCGVGFDAAGRRRVQGCPMTSVQGCDFHVLSLEKVAIDCWVIMQSTCTIWLIVEKAINILILVQGRLLNARRLVNRRAPGFDVWRN